MNHYLTRINLLLEQDQEVLFKHLVFSFLKEAGINRPIIETYQPHLTVFYGLLNRQISETERNFFKNEVNKYNLLCNHPFEIVRTPYNTVSAQLLDRSQFRKIHFVIVRQLLDSFSEEMQCLQPPFYFKNLKLYVPHISVGFQLTRDQSNKLWHYVRGKNHIKYLNFSGIEITSEQLNKTEQLDVLLT